MKNFIKTGLLIAMLFTTLGAYAADDNFLLKVNKENEKSIVFFISEAQDVNLSIHTADNEVIYEQLIHTTGASKKVYNLDAFPNGTYVLKLETTLNLTSYEISIENGKAVISSPTVKEFFKPVLTQEKEMIVLNLKNKVKGAIDIIILNEYNDQLYSKSFTNADLIQKFNISKTDAKELTFVVKYQGEEHIETFKLR